MKTLISELVFIFEIIIISRLNKKNKIITLILWYYDNFKKIKLKKKFKKNLMLLSTSDFHNTDIILSSS